MRVGFGCVLAGFGGGVADRLAGLVGVLPKLAGDRGVLSLLNGKTKLLPFGERVEGVSGEVGGDDVIGVAVGSVNDDASAAGGDLFGGVGGSYQLGELGRGKGGADGFKNDFVVGHGFYPPVKFVLPFGCVELLRSVRWLNDSTVAFGLSSVF